MKKCNGEIFTGYASFYLAVEHFHGLAVAEVCIAARCAPCVQPVDRAHAAADGRMAPASSSLPRAAWQVHDQRLPQRPAHRTAQRSKRRMQQSIGAHPFRQSVDQSVRRPASWPPESRPAQPARYPPSSQSGPRLCMASQRCEQSNPAHREASPSVTRRAPRRPPATGGQPARTGRPALPAKQRSLIVSTTARISDEKLSVTSPVYGCCPLVS